LWIIVFVRHHDDIDGACVSAARWFLCFCLHGSSRKLPETPDEWRGE
jgi:hypothetical protein